MFQISCIKFPVDLYSIKILCFSSNAKEVYQDVHPLTKFPLCYSISSIFIIFLGYFQTLYGKFYYIINSGKIFAMQFQSFFYSVV
jgi:hypothetical protein